MEWLKKPPHATVSLSVRSQNFLFIHCPGDRRQGAARAEPKRGGREPAPPRRHAAPPPPPLPPGQHRLLGVAVRADQTRAPQAREAHHLFPELYPESAHARQVEEAWYS
jgi:hypothetical protein